MKRCHTCSLANLQKGFYEHSEARSLEENTYFM
jgi:hypothetical protein